MATATELRSLITRLSDAAAADLAELWAVIVGTTDASDALMDTIPSLVDDYGDAATLVAAEWYDEYRAELNISGSYTADLAILDLGGPALAGWGSSLLTPDDVDWDAALERISGGLEKRVAVAARETITQNVDNDPLGVGWQRQARATGCGFCQMLAGRGEVYKSRDTANFGAHDHCQCVAMPAFGGRPVPVKPYTPTAATITDADRARTREWIKANL
jgi:hypothetical protein